MFRQATVALRPETPGDRTFLLELYWATRENEPGFRDLAPVERTQLLAHQFEMQHRQYRAAFPQGWFTIVTVDDRPAGRLYVAQRSGELRVIDISLLPQFRGHGIGTQLLKNIQAESLRTGLPIRLSVVNDNPHRGFYTRLGFDLVSSQAVRSELEWQPGPAGAAGG